MTRLVQLIMYVFEDLAARSARVLLLPRVVDIINKLRVSTQLKSKVDVEFRSQSFDERIVLVSQDLHVQCHISNVTFAASFKNGWFRNVLLISSKV